MGLYSEKLKDPRWQKKRLEIMDKAGWKCEYCLTTTKTLHVHHGLYWKNTEPWDYPNVSYHCLCEECHIRATDWIEDIKDWMGTVPVEKLEGLADILQEFDLVSDLYFDYLYEMEKEIESLARKRSKNGG